MIIPVVAAVIARQNPHLEVLLHKKDEPRNPELLGKWEFPGGMMEYGENPEEALERELEEELGIDLQPYIYGPLYVKSNIYESKEHYLVIYYKCMVPEDLGPLPDTFKWFPTTEVGKLDTLPGTWKVIQLLILTWRWSR